MFPVKSVESYWEFKKNEFLLVRDKFIPKSVGTKNKNTCKWVPSKLLKFRKAKKGAWISYFKSGKKVELYDIYTTKLRESVKLNKLAKIEFEHKFAQNAK